MRQFTGSEAVSGIVREVPGAEARVSWPLGPRATEVENRLIVTFFYLDADAERDEDRGGATVADFAGC